MVNAFIRPGDLVKLKHRHVEVVNSTVRENFKHTLNYLEDKKGLMATLQYIVFKKIAKSLMRCRLTC